MAKVSDDAVVFGWFLLCLYELIWRRVGRRRVSGIVLMSGREL